jgi:hypothetical protein
MNPVRAFLPCQIFRKNALRRKNRRLRAFCITCANANRAYW